MKIKRFVPTILFCVVVVLLIAAIVTSFFVIRSKNKTISDNKSQITEISKELDEAKAQIAEKDKANGELTAKLEQAETDKANLQQENSNLKTEIEKLNAKRLIEAEKLTALQNSPQSIYPPNERICYLTFDDGPSDNTLKILDILDAYNAKATFFVMGASKLEYIPLIYQRGHTVGLHSDTHRYDIIYSSTDAYFADLNAISNKVEQLIGIKSRVIRFPGGGSNGVSKQYCEGIMSRLTTQVKVQGYAYFDWNVSSGDADGNDVPAQQIINNVLTQAQNKNSICVLMHDTMAKSTTVEALPYIIEGLAGMGYRFEALSESANGYWHAVNN